MPRNTTPKKRRAATVTPEKRAARYRSDRPMKLQERFVRSTTQRMYLIKTSLDDYIDNNCKKKVQSKAKVEKLSKSSGKGRAKDVEVIEILDNDDDDWGKYTKPASKKCASKSRGKEKDKPSRIKSDRRSFDDDNEVEFIAVKPAPLDSKKAYASPAKKIKRDDESIDIEAADAVKDVLPESCIFTVLGSTGNVYNVTLQSPIWTCDCPDFLGTRDLCKHMMFVMHKVVGLEPQDPLSFQRALLSSEVKHILTTFCERLNCMQISNDVIANDKVQRAARGEDVDERESTAARQPITTETVCPICFDSILDLNNVKVAKLGGGAAAAAVAHDPPSNATYCRAQCGTNFHTDCIKRWADQRRGEATCPNCREAWTDGKIQVNEGYLNYGRLQGQNRHRFASDYTRYVGRGRRERGNPHETFDPYSVYDRFVAALARCDESDSSHSFY